MHVPVPRQIGISVLRQQVLLIAEMRMNIRDKCAQRPRDHLALMPRLQPIMQLIDGVNQPLMLCIDLRDVDIEK